MKQDLDDLDFLRQLADRTGYARYDSLLLVAELVRLFAPVAPLELGVMHGCSTAFIVRALAEGVTLTAIDDFTLAPLEGTVANLSRLRIAERVRLIRGDTTRAGELIDFRPDFVFFDASHTDATLLAEFESLRPLLAPRALLVIDDTLCAPGALAEIGKGAAKMMAFPVHFGLCAVLREAAA